MPGPVKEAGTKPQGNNARGNQKGGRGRGRGGRGRGGKQQGQGQQQQQQQRKERTPEEVAALKARREQERKERKAAEEARKAEYEAYEAAQRAAEEEAAAKRAAAAKAAEEEAARKAAELAAIEAAKSPLLRKVEAMQKLFLAKKGDKAERVAAGEELVTLCEAKEYEPYILSTLLPTVLETLNDKTKEVREVCEKASLAFAKNLQPHALKEAVKTIFVGLDEAAKWRTKCTSLAMLKILANSEVHTAFFIECLPEIIPVLMGVLWDTKKEVTTAAYELLDIVFNKIDNRDLEPLIPALTSAMGNLSEIPECIQTLASTTFVQTVDAAALAVIVPLLVRGFREKSTAIKRQCCVIITNMSKLVEVPTEAAPFLPQLVPELERASEAISDPEARSVAQRSHEHLLRIKGKADEALAKKQAEIDAISAPVREAVASISKGEILPNFVVFLTESMCRHNIFAEQCGEVITPFIRTSAEEAKVSEIVNHLVEFAKQYAVTGAQNEEEDEGVDLLCDTTFTLAYGSKVLLHNTKLKLQRGKRYGLLGGNESGKTTLMRALAQGSVDGFPPRSEVRTVFVESDIQGDISHFSCTEYVLADEELQALGVTDEEARKVLLSVSFTEKMLDDPVSTLSGGWRMKLALARAMMQKADLILMDEPTNHLDVINVQWVVDFITSKKNENVTCIMVSHDAAFLDKTATHILHIDSLKLHLYKGNLSNFVESHPEAKSLFELTATKMKMKFPQPQFIVKSKGKALMKMDKCTFTYPGNDKPTISDITVQVSLSSRVACLGVNGAGKSTMIKLLTGQLEPQTGTVWKHANAKIAYVAQHAFEHIEKHLDKTANEYIRWRYEGGEDKEGLEKASMKISDEEAKKCAQPIQFDVEENGKVKKVKMVIERLTGGRKQGKKGDFEYEVQFVDKPMTMNRYIRGDKLEDYGFGKHVKQLDSKIEAREGQYARALTQQNVEEHLEDVGLDREFGTHNRMAALSGGQKVKIVLAAAMWMQPHIVILDEPTNYLDRESLGALAGAIKEFEGGVVMVSHHNEFCSALCPETWVLENGLLDCQGDPEWMKAALAQKVEYVALDEMVDGNGNVVKVKQQKKKLSRKEQKARAKKKAHALANGLEWSDSEDDDF